MPFGDADVEGAVGHGLHEQVHGAACGHGGGYADDARVLLGEFDEGLSEDVLEEGWEVAGVRGEAFAGFGVELAGCVPDFGGVFGGLESFALDGVEVEDFGAFHLLDVPQDAGHVDDVVSVDGSEVAYVHAFEDVLLSGGDGLEAVSEAYECLSAVFVEDAQAEEQLGEAESQSVVGVGGGEVEEVLLHASHASVDGHVVVVEDDEEVVRRGGGVVEAFEGESSAHGSVADDGYHVAVFFTFGGGCHGHAECGRDGV